MSNYGQRHRPPSSGGPKEPQGEDPKFIGGGVDADRAWAQQRIRSHFEANRTTPYKPVPYGWPAPPRIERKAADTGDWRKRLGGGQEATGAGKHEGAAKGGGAAIPQAGGSPLPAEVRAKMEPQLGGDLSGVKVHTGAESAKAADGLGARAFAVGQDVHFGSGEYQPGTKEGDRLLGHELAHTVQAQKAGVQRKADEGAEAHGRKEGALEISEPADPAEQAADAAGDRVAKELHGDEKSGDGHAADAGGQHTDDAGHEKAPDVGAPPEGVARKIHLAKGNRNPAADKDEKNPADAAVKRLGRSGQDKQQLKDALKAIQHERGAVVEELTKLQEDLPSLGLSRQRANEVGGRIRATVRAVEDHLTDADITGAMRDTASDPVRQAGSGAPYDHLQEVNDALASLSRTRTELVRVRGELERRQIDPKTIAAKLDPALDAITGVVNSVKQALVAVKT